MTNGTTDFSYLRRCFLLALLVCFGAGGQVEATTFLRYRAVDGASLWVSKNGANLVGEWGNPAGISTGEVSIGGELEDGDIIRMWRGSFNGTPIYRDDDLGAEYVHHGANSANGQRFPTSSARWDMGEAAPPTTWCIDIVLKNENGVAVDYIVNYANPTTGALVTPFEGFLADGQTATISISGLTSTVHVGIGERTLGGLAYFGNGEFVDEGEPGPWSFRAIAGPTDPGWYVCSGTADPAVQAVHKMAKVGLDSKGTNLPIDFSQTNVVLNPSNSTNLMTEKSGQIGFQTLAVLSVAANKQAQQAALDTGAKLDGIRDALRSMTNGGGTASTVYAITNGTAQIMGSLTNALGGGGTNAGLLRAIVQNTSNIVDQVTGIHEIMKGTNVTEGEIEEHRASAVNQGGTNVQQQAWYADAEGAGLYLQGELAAANATTFTAPEAEYFKVSHPMGAGVPDLVMDFSPVSSPVIAGITAWIRRAIYAMLIIGFFMFCFKRAQYFTWKLFQSSTAPAISGNVSTWIAQRTVGWVIVEATMATIASVPGLAMTSISAMQGGWPDIVGTVATVTGVGETFVGPALGVANLYIPMDLVVTQFISGAIFELAIAQFAMLAMGVLKFLKVFAIAWLVSLSLDRGTQAASVTILNWTGGPVTNLAGGEYRVYPAGAGRYELPDGENEFTWTDAAFGYVPVEDEELELTQASMSVSTSNGPWFWFNLGLGIHTSLWISGWLVNVYRSYGRDVVAAVTE